MNKAPSPCPLPKGEGFHSVRVRAPCRLHFGMFSFGHADRPQFGGVGVMIELPCIEITLSPGDRYLVLGDHTERVKRFVAMAVRRWQLSLLPRCCVEVRSPPDHTGLGVGTQLGLAVAAGLRRFLNLPELPVESLASSVARGGRSAVGTYGFQHGGLIVDAGKQPGEPLARLADRVAVPTSWRFVLVRPANVQGLAGDREAEAFSGLPPVSEKVTHELWKLTNEEMLPGVKAADCKAFGEAVYCFGRLAGECFSAAQGGPFASPEIAALIGRIREFGVSGVGQSSWGPTIFALTADEADAERLVRWLRNQESVRNCEITVARANNTGATID